MYFKVNFSGTRQHLLGRFFSVLGGMSHFSKLKNRTRVTNFNSYWCSFLETVSSEIQKYKPDLG